MEWSLGSAPTAQAVTVTCPRCGAADARTLRVIHESGTTTSRGTATGWTTGSGSQQGHLTTFSTSSKSQTDAAKAAAPPRKRRNGVALIGLGVAVPLVAIAVNFLMNMNSPSEASAFTPVAVVGVAVGLVLLVIGFVLAPRDHRYNSEEFPTAFRDWERSWACQRCGTRFLA